MTDKCFNPYYDNKISFSGKVGKTKKIMITPTEYKFLLNVCDCRNKSYICVISGNDCKYVEKYLPKETPNGKQEFNQFLFAENYFNKINGTYKNNTLHSVNVTGEMVLVEDGRFLFMVENLICFNSDKKVLQAPEISA